MGLWGPSSEAGSDEVLASSFTRDVLGNNLSFRLAVGRTKCPADGICRPRKVNATVMMMHPALLKAMNMMHLTAKRTRFWRQNMLMQESLLECVR